MAKGLIYYCAKSSARAPPIFWARKSSRQHRFQKYKIWAPPIILVKWDPCPWHFQNSKPRFRDTRSITSCCCHAIGHSQVRQKIKICWSCCQFTHPKCRLIADRGRSCQQHLCTTTCMCTALTSLIFRNVVNLTLNLKPRNSEFPARKCEETILSLLYISTPGTTAS